MLPSNLDVLQASVEFREVPKLPQLWGTRGDGTAAHGAASGAVHSAPTFCVLEAGRQGHAFSPGNPRNAPRDQPALLDSSRKGWATALFVLLKPKPQIFV